MRSNGPKFPILPVLLLIAATGVLAVGATEGIAQERRSSPEPRRELRGASDRGASDRGSSDRRSDDQPRLRLPRGEDPETAARELLLGAKDALSSGNVTFLRPHFGQKVYLNLFTGINGYYSAGQTTLILEAFFSTYRPISFSFSSRNFSIRNPYGFGPITLAHRGKRETAEMFISLASVNNRWVISQITIALR